MSAPFVIGPTNPGLYWFDPQNMRPLIESPGHVRALEVLVDLVQFGPREMLGWESGKSWDYFLAGRAALTFTWGDLGALARVRRDVDEHQVAFDKIFATDVLNSHDGNNLVEKFGSNDFATHITLLEKEVVIIEGVDLREVSPGDYELVCLPLKYLGGEGDGAPARTILRTL